MAASDTPTVQSDWNAAAEILKKFSEALPRVQELVNANEYEAAVTTFWNCAMNFPMFITSFNSLEVIRELREITERIRELEEYDSPVIDHAISNLRLDFLAVLDESQHKLMLDLSHQHVLFPTSETLDTDDEESVADNYEKLAYNSLDSSQHKTVPYLRDYWGCTYISDNFKALLERQHWLQLKRDKDGLFIIGGYPGSGKSVKTSILETSSPMW